jgi:uncharacterized protein YcbX
MIKITALNIYPVKACRGIALDSAHITPSGFEHDREWLIVSPEGRFMTQREEPRLALVETHIGAATLRLRSEGHGALEVPLRGDGETVEVTCWRDRCAAFDAGKEAAMWLSDYLGRPARLVRFDARRKRPADPGWTKGVEALNRFTDAFPWLLISQASLDDLNARLPQPLPMNRFRPNIVVDGLPPYGEDHVYEFIAGTARLRVVKPCARCVVTTTDQDRGERDGEEPLRTLKKYRFDRSVMGVAFGQNLILSESDGEASLTAGQEIGVDYRTGEPGEANRSG